MQALDQVLGASGVDLQSLGTRFGLSPEQTRSAMESLMPAVVEGFQRQAAADDSASIVPAGGSREALDASVGNDVLGSIFGSKDVSRQVANHAAGASGVAPAVLKAMLPIVAAMVARHVATSGGAGRVGTGRLWRRDIGRRAGRARLPARRPEPSRCHSRGITAVTQEARAREAGPGASRARSSAVAEF